MSEERRQHEDSGKSGGFVKDLKMKQCVCVCALVAGVGHQLAWAFILGFFTKVNTDAKNLCDMTFTQGHRTNSK